MTVNEFALKNNFSGTDQNIVNKIYGDEKREELQWFQLLKDKVNFIHKPYLKSNSKKKDIVDKIKQEKKSSKTK